MTNSGPDFLDLASTQIASLDQGQGEVNSNDDVASMAKKYAAVRDSQEEPDEEQHDAMEPML